VANANSPAPGDRDATVRRWLFVLAGAFAGLTLVGSLVPFHYRHSPWEQAVRWLLNSAWFRPGQQRWGDWVNNILLFIPLGFLLVGACLYRRSTPRRAALATGCILLYAALQSLLNEFLQHWFAPRIPNPADVHANLLGATLGILVWLAETPFWEARLAAGITSPRLPRAGLIALTLGLVVWGLWSLMPLDITLHPVDLIRKISRGAILWNPLSSRSWNHIADHPLQTLLGLLMGVPLGVWTTRIARPAVSPVRPWLTGTLAGVWLLMLLELLQLLFSTRAATTLDILIGGLGVALGAALARFQAGPARAEMLAEDDRSSSRIVVFMALVLHALFLCYHFWKPLELVRDRAKIEQKLLGLRGLPFRGLFAERTPVAVLTDCAEKLLLFALLGCLLRATLEPPGSRRPAPLRFWLPTLALGALFVVGIEATQAVWKDRFPHPTDVCLGWIGIVVGGSLFDHLRPHIERLIPPTR